MNQLTLFDVQVWEQFVKPGEVVEARFIKVKGRFTESGYFDDHQAFCKCVKQLDTSAHSGAYFTVQVIDPRLLGRAFNRIKQTDLTTSDSNVLAYRWLPIDIDPVRPAGVAASDEELQAALCLRDIVRDHVIKDLGFSAPMRAMSGNGGHLLFRLPDLPVTDQNKIMIRNILSGLSKRFNTDKVRIDTTVFNPARIWKLYGTTARKGDPVTAGPNRDARPHRMSFIDDLGDNS
jgi:hypothetical protein